MLRRTLHTHAFILLSSIIPLFFVATVASGQSVPRVTVSGVVTDTDSREGLPGVNVFLAGTTLGGTTDTDGAFSIQSVPSGEYDIVISIPGYEREIRRVTVPLPGKGVLRIGLKEKVIEAEGVEITGERRVEWQRDVRRFEHALFKNTEFGSKCRLTNPEVIDFTTDRTTGRFEARASESLFIENDALGYRIELVLRRFEVEKGRLVVSGLPKFEAMAASSPEQKKMWSTNRERAFKGSLRHFLSALVRDSLSQEGFSVSVVSQISLARQASLIPEDEIRSDILRSGILGYERMLTFPEMLKVEYLGEYQEPGFEEFWRRQTGGNGPGEVLHQVSWLSLSVTSVFLNVDGMPYDTSVLQTYGYWAYERLGEWVPVEYRPE